MTYSFGCLEQEVELQDVVQTPPPVILLDQIIIIIKMKLFIWLVTNNVLLQTTKHKVEENQMEW
jgi:hypothetical protein